MAGVVTGRKIRSVKINPNGTGATNIVPPAGFGYGVAAFVGYVGASAAGLIAAVLISTGRMVAVLWLGLVLFAVMLLTVRNFFGGIVILTCGALLYLVVRYGTAGVDTTVAYGVAWFLLISGTRVALGIVRRPSDVADAGVLAGMTFLWRWVWCLLWLAGTIAALAFGGRILIRGLGGLYTGFPVRSASAHAESGGAPRRRPRGSRGTAPSQPCRRRQSAPAGRRL
jgi:hypothetical protein